MCTCRLQVWVYFGQWDHEGHNVCAAYMPTVVFVVYDLCVVWMEQMDCELFETVTCLTVNYVLQMCCK